MERTIAAATTSDDWKPSMPRRCGGLTPLSRIAARKNSVAVVTG